MQNALSLGKNLLWFIQNNNNISLSVGRCMKHDHTPFVSGLRVTEDITAGKATWETLFEPPNFFQQYKWVPACFFMKYDIE